MGTLTAFGKADAVLMRYKLPLTHCHSATWVFEADITGCYDNISKEWMLDNIAMDNVVLRKWLDAGSVENGITYPTRKRSGIGDIKL
jgi:RNA-directed DNA polymerase